MVLKGIEITIAERTFYQLLHFYQKNKPSEEGIEGLTKIVDSLVEVDTEYSYLYDDIALLTVPKGICI